MRRSTKKYIHCKQEVESGGTLDVIMTKRKLIIYLDISLMDELATDYLELQMKSEAVIPKSADVLAAWESILEDERWYQKNKVWMNCGCCTLRIKAQQLHLFPSHAFLLQYLGAKRSLAIKVQLTNSFGQDSVYVVTCDTSLPKHIYHYML